MTYCVAVLVDDGISYCSDSRTSAGVDQINTYSKMFRFGQDGNPPHLSLICPQGNHISTSRETPFLQIGETKYGKPILDRIITSQTPLNTAALCSLISMDSTMRSNLSVGPPIDIQLYHTDSFIGGEYYHLPEDSQYLRDVNLIWNQRMIESVASMPPLDSVLAVTSDKGSDPVL